MTRATDTEARTDSYLTMEIRAGSNCVMRQAAETGHAERIRKAVMRRFLSKTQFGARWPVPAGRVRR